MSTQGEDKEGLDAINKLKSTDPPLFLSPNSELSSLSRIASQYLFNSLKPYCPKSPFEQLLTEGFDAEQIWQQIDLQSQPLLTSLKREIKGYERNPENILSSLGVNEGNGVLEREIKENGGVGFEEDGEEFEGLSDEDEEEEMESGEDEEEEEDDYDDESEEDELEDDDDGVPEVEDDFLKIKDLEKYLVKEEKKEYGSQENKKKDKTKKKKNLGAKVDDDEDEDDEMEEGEDNDGELLLYGGDASDEDGSEDKIRYDDFFVPNKKTPTRKRKQVDESDDWAMENKNNDDEEMEDEDEDDDEDEDEDVDDLKMEDNNNEQNKGNLSTYEKEREKIQAKIKQLEAENLAPKDWTMQGEVSASKRPKDSALEVDLDFQHNMRPPPVITEEVTASLEEIIKKRILEGHFDDVERAPKLPSAAPKEKKELDDNKSKKGLAEIYEDEYAQQTGLVSAPLSFNDELKKEASSLFKRLCLKLDALSHFHFAPKPVVEDMAIQTNVPALAMEEIAPVAVSDAAMLAPEEVFTGKKVVKEENEFTKEDRKKRRAKKKRKLKAINARKAVRRAPEKPSQTETEGKE